MKNKPNPEEFARQILWPLCGLRAELRIMLSMFSRQIEPDIQKADAIYAAWIGGALKLQQKLYSEAVAKAGIPPLGDEGLESSDFGSG